MLPAVTTRIKRNALIAATALSIAAVPAAPALAWGSNEQNFLKGVVATVAVQALIREAKSPRHNQPVYAQPVYSEPSYRPVYTQPSYGSSLYSTASARAFQSYTPQERRLIQRRLSAYGYYRGGIDGAYGPNTAQAIASYARDQGMGRKLGSTSGAYGVLDSLIA